jgi:hypothetical protein
MFDREFEVEMDKRMLRDGGITFLFLIWHLVQ